MIINGYNTDTLDPMLVLANPSASPELKAWAYSATGQSPSVPESTATAATVPSNSSPAETRQGYYPLPLSAFSSTSVDKIVAANQAMLDALHAGDVTAWNTAKAAYMAVAASLGYGQNQLPTWSWSLSDADVAANQTKGYVAQITSVTQLPTDAPVPVPTLTSGTPSVVAATQATSVVPPVPPAVAGPAGISPQNLTLQAAQQALGQTNLRLNADQWGYYYQQATGNAAPALLSSVYQTGALIDFNTWWGYITGVISGQATQAGSVGAQVPAAPSLSTKKIAVIVILLIAVLVFRK